MSLFIIFIVAQCLLCGCSGSGDVLDDAEDSTSPYQVLIDLDIPDMGENSRADYDDGRLHPYENFIDINNSNYRFYAFDFDNKYIATLKVEEIWAIESPETTPPALLTSSKKYQVLASFDDDPGPNFKIVALANWNGYGGYYGDVKTMTSGVTTINDLLIDTTAEFSIKDDITTVPAANNLIPMFGVKEFEGIKFTNVRVWLGDLHMLRAISKVEVSIDPNISPKIHFNSLKLKNYYKLGVAMPNLTNYLQAEYVKTGFASEYRTPVTMRFGDQNPRNAELDLSGKIQDDKVIFFLPETRIIEFYDSGLPFVKDKRTRMTATFTMEGNSSFDSTHEYDIEFMFYDEQAATNAGAQQYDFFDIRRNYFYRFAIRSISGANLTLYADVVPYTTVSLRPIFGFPQEEVTEEEDNSCCGCTQKDENGVIKGCTCSSCNCCPSSSSSNSGD